MMIEQVIQHMVLDSTRECAATEDPVRQYKLAFELAARQHADGAERSKFVLITDSVDERAWVVEMFEPLAFAQSGSVQVELIGLVDQFEQSLIGRVLAAVKDQPSV